jgi:type IV pilus assembly protein PilX
MKMLGVQSSQRCDVYVGKSQSGVVLIFALIMLVVISMVALTSLKNSVSGEQVSNNLRTNALATQAAEAALRYCENQVLTSAAGLVINEVSLTGTTTLPNLWETRSNWTSTFAMVVPASFVDSTVGAARPQRTLPMCMVERNPLLTLGGAAPRNSFLISSIGYSPDYSKNASGVVVAGGEVWMQLLLRY